jgi:hypothetical protein
MIRKESSSTTANVSRGLTRRVRQGYISASSVVRRRGTRAERIMATCSENVPTGGRAYPSFPSSDFPRNEGVRGSNPRVGSLSTSHSWLTVRRDSLISPRRDSGQLRRSSVERRRPRTTGTALRPRRRPALREKGIGPSSASDCDGDLGGLAVRPSGDSMLSDREKVLEARPAAEVAVGRGGPANPLEARPPLLHVVGLGREED